MSEFLAFLQMGFQHISDLRAYDHMLFIITLCAVYRLEDWRKILVLITAFTVGHSVTLALSALGVLSVPSDLVEFLIPVTILLTSLHNVSSFSKRKIMSRNVNLNYLLALFFGLIHGMGFANYFRGLFGEMKDILWPLFSFNVGIELGQLLIVACFFGFYYLLKKGIWFEHKSWCQFISGAGAGVSVILILENIMG